MPLKRSRLSISVDSKIVEWLEKEITDGKYFNKSHGFEKVMKDHMHTTSD